MSSTFLAITQRQSDLDWLKNSLSTLGQVLQVDHDSLDALLNLVDVTQASLIFVGLDRDNLNQHSVLIEDCLAAKPQLTVVALGDGLDNQLVLSAMRAGARDFVAYGSRSSEVAGLVRRLSKRLPTVLPTQDQADLISLYCTEADVHAAMICLHVALSLVTGQNRVLLLDLGCPEGESLESLGVTTSFQFEDALRNMRRLDANLIESAFAQHSSGLRMLSLFSEKQLGQTSATEMYLLLGALRQHFSHVVINLAGISDGDALRVVLNQSRHWLWLSDQSVPNCRRNLEQLNLWRSEGVNLNHAQLLVDRCLKGVTPSPKDLAVSYDLPLLDTLPYQPELRLNAKNQGVSLFALAPREALSKRLKALALHLVDSSAHTTKRRFSWWGSKR